MKTRTLAAACLSAALASACAAEVGFKVAPTARRAGGKVTIAFEVDAPTDVAVSVLDGNGKVVRHLAAGRLGKAAPEPFKSGPLAQAIEWDMTDDAGKPAGAGPFKVRVGLALRPRLHRIIGWSGQKLAGVSGLASGPDGTLYVVTQGGLYAHRTTWLILAYDRDGRYLRQILPGPAGLPAEKRKGWPWITLDDGTALPVVHHLLPRTTYPGAVFDQRTFPVVTADRRIICVTGAGHTNIKYPDLRGGRRLMVLGVDGSVPADFLGPEICPLVGGYAHIALSPDEKHVYATGFVDTGRKGKGPVNVVYRVALDGSKPAEVLIGKPHAAGGGKAALSDPQGIAVDRDGNIHVADYGHDRVAVFKPGGGYLGEVPVEHPDTVLVSRKTGAVYVVQIRKRAKGFTDAHWYTPAHNWRLERIVKFASRADKTPQAVFVNPYGAKERHGGGAYAALDETGDRPVLWVAGLRYGGRPVCRVVDAGDKLTMAGTPIDDLRRADKAEHVGFIGDVAVSGGKVLTRFPAMGWTSPTSLTYSAETGQFLGTYTPKKDSGKPANVWTLLYGEAVAGLDGYLYYHARYNVIRKYDLAGKPAPFVGTGTCAVSGFWHGHTRGAGLFVDRDGTIYVPAAEGNRKIEDMKVKVVKNTGEIVNDNLIHVQGARMGGIAVDPAGNVYIGAQVAPRDRRLPERFAGKLPPDSPAHHPSLDYKQHATIFKFPPTGGRIIKDPDGPLVGHCQYRATPLRVEGALWSKRIGYIGSHGKELGCHCETTRFDVDAFGRVFAPDPFRFSVSVFDGAGNEITRFGSYGNMDSRGSGSPVPTPKIPLGWPLSVECAGGRAFIADLVNRRIVAVNLDCAVEAECKVP